MCMGGERVQRGGGVVRTIRRGVTAPVSDAAERTRRPTCGGASKSRGPRKRGGVSANGKRGGVSVSGSV